MKKPTFQRTVQTGSLLLFVVLLWGAGTGLAGWLDPDLFMRLDPLAVFGAGLADKTWPAGFWLCIGVLACTALLGRFFCGHLCPMGATVDAGDAVLRRKRDGRWARHGSWRPVKYLLATFFLAGAAAGVSLVFLSSPMPLAARFWGQLAHPVLAGAADAGLQAVRPLAMDAGWNTLAFAELQVPRYAGQLFVVVVFGAVFAAAYAAPRFWCRYLCPAGAVFALVSRRPLIHRRVSEACTHCGACARVCPMQAIPDEPHETAFSECITCEACVRICPVEAIDFGPRRPAQRVRPSLPGRRGVVLAGAAGVVVSVLGAAGLGSGYAPGGVGRADGAFPIRPPGALPEPDFLARCVRCGLCMEACPTNTLQPAWLQAGWAGVFAPVLTPERGPCEPLCRACTQVCPTLAIRPLELVEKQQAKVGTAYVIRTKCLAWEQDKECLVCDEVCPYDAIELRRVAENRVPVPFVREKRCIGCGFCEHHCPVRAKRAIVVEPGGELRLAEGSYARAARQAGLDLDLERAPDPAEGGAYGGYAPQKSYGDGADGGFPDELPPGFSEPE